MASKKQALLILVASLALVNAFGVPVAEASSPLIRLVVAYCPSTFSGAGAVVDVDTEGQFTVVQRFKWASSETLGCPVNVDPNNVVAGQYAFLDFVDDWGEVSIIDVTNGSLVRSLAAHSPVLFDGFTSMDLVTESGEQFLQGPTPHVEQSGWCSDGCFQFGKMSLSSGDYTPLQDIPYRAVMTDCHFANHSSNRFYIQASYPLDAAASCSSNETHDCLVELNSQTGAIVSTKLANKFTVYKYSQTDSNGRVLAWVYGFEGQCRNPYDDFAFAWVDLASATAELIACIPKDVVVHTNPMIASFAPDGSLFAQASGNAETGEIQLLVLNTKTGDAVLNSKLTGLVKALGGSSEMPFVDIWAVAFE